LNRSIELRQLDGLGSDEAARDSCLVNSCNQAAPVGVQAEQIAQARSVRLAATFKRLGQNACGTFA
jgi:hypothetical protein